MEPPRARAAALKTMLLPVLPQSLKRGRRSVQRPLRMLSAVVALIICAPAMCGPLAADEGHSRDSEASTQQAGTQQTEAGRASTSSERTAERRGVSSGAPQLASRSLGLSLADFDPFATTSEKMSSEDWDASPYESIAPRANSRSRANLATRHHQPGPYAASGSPMSGAWMPEPVWQGSPWPGSLWPEQLWTEPPGCVDCAFAGAVDSNWESRLFPQNLIFKSYLAGMKESRISGIWFHDDRLGWQWESTLGGRVGLLRYGTGDNFPYYPQGWQLDIEGAAFPRLDLEEGRRDLVSSDFRFGVPITYARGRYQAKLAYYHLSAHLGDEYLLRTGATRINFVRDVIVWGNSYYPSDVLRLYGEVGYGIHVDGGSKPWEFQFGFELAPACPTGFEGAPFFAANAHLREEFNYGGNVTVQTGWAWRSRRGGPLGRIGFHYLNGKSSQWELFDTFEEQLGFGLWYDY